MWIFTNISGTDRGAFLSIVAKDRDGKPSGAGPAGELSVRARRKEDLTALFPGADVLDIGGAGDYQFRVFATRHEVSTLLCDLVEDMNYTNFKDSICGDLSLKRKLMNIWDDMSLLQPVEPYSERWPPRNAPQYTAKKKRNRK